MKFLLILAIIGGIIYGRSLFNREIQRLESLSKTTHPKQVDYRIVKLERFFRKFNSPLSVYATDFVNASDKYNLPYYLLPLVSMVESSGGRNYSLNVFGWGSDTLDFGTDLEDIYGVAGKIATLSYYRKFRETKDINDFALAYNFRYAKDYTKKLTYFYEQLN